MRVIPLNGTPFSDVFDFVLPNQIINGKEGDDLFLAFAPGVIANGGDGDDTFSLDFENNDLSNFDGLRLNGGDGYDTLKFSVTSDFYEEYKSIFDKIQAAINQGLPYTAVFGDTKITFTGMEELVIDVSSPETVIDFELINFGDVRINEIDPNYQGFVWSSSVSVIHETRRPNSGYDNVTGLSEVALFNALASDITVSRSTDFDFKSGYFAAAWNNDLNINIKAFDDGFLVGEATIVLNPQRVFVDFENKTTLGANFATFSGTFESIDQLVFSSGGGSNAGLGFSGMHMATDDWTVVV